MVAGKERELNTDSGAVELPEKRTFLSARAVIIGTVLAPLICYWVAYTQIRANSTDLTMMSLMTAAVFPLIILMILNKVFRSVSPKLVFTRAEILTIYAMLIPTVGLAGGGYIPFLATSLTAPVHYASPINNWNSWTFLLKPWSYISDPVAVQQFYDGKNVFLTPEHLKVWTIPVISWSLFLLAVISWGYCLNVFFRRAWMDNEKLAFPIAQIAIEITRTDNHWGKNKLFWIGIAIPTCIETLNTLHFTAFPTLPYVSLKPDGAISLNQYFINPPWNGIQYFTLAFYPLAIGLSFLIPTSTSFSCWFFYLFTKAELVLAAYFGIRQPSAPMWDASYPDILMQGTGGFIMLAFLAFYTSRHHLRSCIIKALTGKGIDDSKEPMTYRAALVSMLIAGIFMVYFAVEIGMAWHVAVFLFISYTLMLVTYTRIRAEAGLPWVMSALFNPHGILFDVSGVNHYNNQDLAALARFEWFDQDWRSHTMANQFDALKIAHTAGFSMRKLTWAIGLATVAAVIGSWYACLHIFYTYGAGTANVCDWYANMGRQAYDLLQMRVSHSGPTTFERVSMFCTGAMVTLFLTIMHQRIPWWPLSPIGYIVANTFTLDWLWCPTLIGWMCKSLIMRYGGIRLYKQALPFFIGLVVGDMVISALWALVFLVLKIPGYRTFPI